MELPVAEIETQTGVELQVLDRLAGGEQEGAHLLKENAGRKLVLKLQPEPWKAERLLRAAPVIDHAVSHGWPAAAWVHVGSLKNGTAFVLQEYVDGEPIATLDPQTLQLIAKANASQSGLAIGEAVNDSQQLESVVAGDHPWKVLVRDHSAAGAALVHHGDDVIRRVGSVQLPVSDVVHGDYSSSNMIMTADRTVRFIDCGTVARGTRVRDLADLYRGCFVYSGTSPTALHPLRDHARKIAGSAVFSTCIVAVSYNNLAWWVEHRSPAEFDQACQRVHNLFADLTRR